MRMTYDVSLSHNSRDKTDAEQIGRLLREKEGLWVFIDKCLPETWKRYHFSAAGLNSTQVRD
jgi:hypothetical protein